MNRPRRFGLFALSVLFAIRAAAHPAPNSVVNLDFGRSSVHAELLLPTSELRYALAAEGIERSSISPGDPAISDYLARHVGLATPAGGRWHSAVRSGHLQEFGGARISCRGTGLHTSGELDDTAVRFSGRSGHA